MSISTSHIVRRRGDTLPVQVCVKDLVGAIEDIDNSTFQMTVGTEPYPATLGTAIFEVAGVINGPSTDGLVDFAIEGGDELHVGFYYFDVEMIDSTGITDTILYGWYEVKQDKTKTDETFVWTPSSVPDDGDPVDPFGIAGPQFNRYYSAPSLTYETRSGRRVIRENGSPAATYDFAQVRMAGSDFPRFTFPLPGWEWRLTVYVNRALVQMQLWDPNTGSLWNRPAIDTRLGTVEADTVGSSLDSSGQYIGADNLGPLDTTGWPVAGWYQLGVRVLPDWSIEWMVKEETGPDVWNDMFIGDATLWPSPYASVTGPKASSGREFPENPVSRVEFWKYEWSQLT